MIQSYLGWRSEVLFLGRITTHLVQLLLNAFEVRKIGNQDRIRLSETRLKDLNFVWVTLRDYWSHHFVIWQFFLSNQNFNEMEKYGVQKNPIYSIVELWILKARVPLKSWQNSALGDPLIQISDWIIFFQYLDLYTKIHPSLITRKFCRKSNNYVLIDEGRITTDLVQTGAKFCC